MDWALYHPEISKFLEGFRPILKDESLSFSKSLSAGGEYIYDYYSQFPLQFAFVMFTQHDFPDNKIEFEKNNPFYVIRNFVVAGIEDGAFRSHNPEIKSRQ
jgi:hypothetical protein